MKAVSNQSLGTTAGNFDSDSEINLYMKAGWITQTWMPWPARDHEIHPDYQLYLKKISNCPMGDIFNFLSDRVIDNFGDQSAMSNPPAPSPVVPSDKGGAAGAILNFFDRDNMEQMGMDELKQMENQFKV